MQTNFELCLKYLELAPDHMRELRPRGCLKSQAALSIKPFQPMTRQRRLSWRFLRKGSTLQLKCQHLFTKRQQMSPLIKDKSPEDNYDIHSASIPLLYLTSLRFMVESTCDYRSQQQIAQWHNYGNNQKLFSRPKVISPEVMLPQSRSRSPKLFVILRDILTCVAT